MLYIVATFFIAAVLAIDLSVADSYLGVNMLAPVLIFLVPAAQAVYKAALWFIVRRWILELSAVELEEERQQEEVVQLNVFGDPVVFLKNTSIDSVGELDTSEEKSDSQHHSLSGIRPIGIREGVSS
jgi:hypothetical protein